MQSETRLDSSLPYQLHYTTVEMNVQKYIVSHCQEEKLISNKLTRAKSMNTVIINTFFMPSQIFNFRSSYECQLTRSILLES